MKRISMFRIQSVKIGSFLFDYNVVLNPSDGEKICRCFLTHEFGGLPDREVFGVIWLNTKNKVIGTEIISIGSLNAAVVHPREVFKSGILHNCASFICFHNHPSGVTDPSNEDIQVTSRLVDAGKLLGIDLLDHIIISEDGYSSLKEIGAF